MLDDWLSRFVELVGYRMYFKNLYDSSGNIKKLYNYGILIHGVQRKPRKKM